MDKFDAAGFAFAFAAILGGFWGLAVGWFWPLLGVVVGLVLGLTAFAVLYLMAVQELPEDIDEPEVEPR